MKVVVLEHPRIPSDARFNDIANTPLWSSLIGGYGAAALQAVGAEVQYLDHAQPGRTFAASRCELLELAPQLLVINAVYFWEHSAQLLALLAELRQQGYAGHLCLIGFFATLMHEEILSGEPAVDSIVVGEVEETLVALYQALSRKESLASIAGLALRSQTGAIKLRRRAPLAELDRLPTPLRGAGAGTVSVLASRGCYNRCSFCLIPPFDGQAGGWRGRSVEAVAAEVEHLVAEGHRDFYFCDPNFIGPGRNGRQRTIELMRLLARLDITFGMETRPNDLDDTVLAAMVEAGLTSLLMGVESGSAGLLRQIGKHSTTEVASQAIALCRRYGLEPEIGFLMFLPDASLEDIAANLHFLEDNRLLDRLERTANLLCHRQIQLKGTAGYAQYQRAGRLRPIGIFGFEGEVVFQDPLVAELADSVLAACHGTLREIGRPESALYWRRPDPFASQARNRELVELFTGHLDRLQAA